MTHWAKFDRCLADVTEQRARAPQVFHKHLDTYIEALRTVQRFYLPDVATVLIDGREYDPFKDLLKLPYDGIALLSETHHRDSPQTGWKITIAINASDQGRRGWWLYTANDLPAKRTHHWWMMIPLVPMFVIIPEEPGGLKYGIADDEAVRAWLKIRGGAPEETLGEFQDDLAAVATLCMMLNTVNVRTIPVQPPAKLNAKRERSGKPPLYAYHVLNVDGEVWDRPEETESAEKGPGVRSHLRRGHIRRLPKGPTWVRAAYVHGSKNGFVDKDYNVKKKP